MADKSQNIRQKVGFFSSIRHQLFVFVMLVIIVPIAITQYVGLTTTQSALKKRIDNNLHERATSSAANLGGFLSEKMSLLQALAENDAIVNAALAQSNSYAGSKRAIQYAILKKNIDWQAADDSNPIIQDVLATTASRELLAYRTLFPAHLELFVSDAYGANVAVSSRTVDYYQADEEWWKKTWNEGKGAFFVADRIEYNGTKHQYNKILALPVVTPEDQVVGVLRSTLDVTALQQEIISIQIGETGHAVLVNGDGKVLVSRSQKDPNSVNGVILTELLPLLDQPYNYQDGEFTLVQDETGVRQVVAVAPVTTSGRFEAIDNLDWHLAIFQAEDEALAPVTDAVGAVLPVVIIITGLGLISAYLLGWRLVNPLWQLTQSARQLYKTQDWSIRTSIVGHNEYGVLGQTINSLAAQLGELISSLETRVAERTRDLEIAADVSRQITTVLDPTQLLPRLVELTAHGFGFELVSVFLCDQETSSMELTATSTNGAYGQRVKEPGTSFSILSSTGLVAKSARIRETIVVNDTSASDVILPDSLSKIRSEAAFPMIVGMELVGVLQLQSEQPGRFSDDDVYVLTALTEQIAIAVRNAQLYSNVQKERQRAENSEQEREQLELQFQAAQRLESIATLAGGVAHDFNNLLLAIMGNVELCKLEIAKDHQVQGELDEILNIADRSAAIVRQLLTFSRKQPIAPKIIDLNNSISNILKMLERLIGEDIELSWKPAEVHDKIKIDLAQLDQILANLCVNARDAIGGVGRISIVTSFIRLDENYFSTHPAGEPGDFVLLSVSDTGCGMDTATCANIFGHPSFETKSSLHFWFLNF